MSMNGAFRSVSARVIAATRENPALAQALTVPGVRISRFADDPEALGPIVGIDKAWHGVHFVLTGSAEPDGSVLGGAILGGEELGDDLGYGPVRLHDPAAVRTIAAALAAFDDVALGIRYDADVMNALGIYPSGWDEDGAGLGMVADGVDAVRSLYAEAAAAEDGLLLWRA